MSDTRKCVPREPRDPVPWALEELWGALVGLCNVTGLQGGRGGIKVKVSANLTAPLRSLPTSGAG